METAQIVEFLLLLLIAASAISMGAARFRVPYTIALVFGGFAIDLFHLPIVQHIGGQNVHLLTPEVVLMLFLPGLLFEAGINIQAGLLKRNLVPILTLAIVGLVIASLITGYAMHLLAGLPLMIALLYGSLISATDPISVLALFKELGVSKRLAVMVEGESLFNDGTAVVLFQILLVSVATNEFDFMAGLGRFLVVALGGAALGLGAGYLFSLITAWVDEPRLEITLTVILAYGSFLLAEHIHVSGVIATVGAGIMIGNYGAVQGMSSRTRVSLWSFWEYWGFVINSLVFLMIGIEVHIADLLAEWRAIALAVALVLLGRAVAIYTVTPIVNRFTNPIPFAWQHVFVWGGIHGSVSMALVLSLPADFEYRSTLLAYTFGVVAFSIVVQGLTIPGLMRKLGIEGATETEYDRAVVGRMALQAAEDELQRLRREHIISEAVYDELREELDVREDAARDHFDGLQDQHTTRLEEEKATAQRFLLEAEKAAIQRATTDGRISGHTAEHLMAEADEGIDAVGGAGGHG